MNILADESIDAEIVQTLRESGFEVEYVAEAFPSVNDDVVLKHAYGNNQFLITQDKDFGDLVVRHKYQHHGVLLVRLDKMKSGEKSRLVQKFIEENFSRLINGFSVLSENNARIRKV